MNVTSKNESSKNGIYIYIYILWKKNKEKIREYGLNHCRNPWEKQKEKEKSMEEIAIKFSNDAKRKTQRMCIKITVKN